MKGSAEAEVRELRAVVELLRELARIGALRGVGVQLRDAVPRMELVTSNGVVVDARLAEGGTEFVWRPTFRRYPITDVPGAARALQTLLRECGHQTPVGGGRGE